MVHQCESLALRLEPRDYLPSVHSGFDQFESDAAAHGFFLFSQPDLTHAAFADNLQKVIAADHGAIWVAYVSGSPSAPQRGYDGERTFEYPGESDDE
jgi:hypothetical protein